MGAFKLKQEALLFLFLWSAVISRMVLVPDVFERKLMETPMSMNEKRYRVCFQDCDSAVPPFKVVDLERGIEYQEREIPPEFHRLPANYINGICDFVGEKGVNFFEICFCLWMGPIQEA